MHVTDSWYFVSTVSFGLRGLNSIKRWVICERRTGEDMAAHYSIVLCRYFLRIFIDGLCNTIQISATCVSGLRPKIRKWNSRAPIRATINSTPTSGISGAGKYFDSYINLFCMSLIIRFFRLLIFGVLSAALSRNNVLLTVRHSISEW
jgi:hypothetical protein